MSYSQWRKWLSDAFTRGTRRRGRKEFRPVSELLEKRCLFNITPTGQHNVGFVEGNANTVLLATFTDTTPSAQGQYAATIQWGDASPPDTTTGQVFATSPGHYNLFGTHTYADENGPTTFTVNLQETGNGNDTATVSGTAIVADAPLSPFAITFSPTEGSAFTGTVASFADQNPSAPASDFSATIDWGDGSSTTPGSVVATGSGNFDVLPTAGHTYADDGNYSVTVSVQDEGGVNATLSSTAAVQEGDLTTTPVGVTLTYSERDPVALPSNLGDFTDPGTADTASDYTARVSWGDNTTSAADVTPNGGSSFHVRDNAGHGYAEEGNYTVTVTISEDGRVVGTITDQANASEADVIGGGQVTGVSPTEGQTFAGTVATFAYSTLTAESGSTTPAAPASDFAATINWGDGSSSAGTVSLVGTTLSVAGSHTYAEDGPYLVTVQVKDDDSGTATGNTAGQVHVFEAPITVTANGPYSAVEGTTLSGTVATFTHPGNEPATEFTATINWGDGGTSTGTVTQTSATSYDVTGSHAYIEDGSFTVTISVADGPGTVGVATEFSQGITASSMPVGITLGPDGNLWFAEQAGSRIGRITPAGTVTEFSTGVTPGSAPSGIVTGPDGNLWFTEFFANQIGRITPAGTVTEFGTGISPSSGVSFLTVGSDGNLWFTEQTGSRIGRITLAGTVTEFATGITPGSRPTDITLGPDGNLWFTEQSGNQIGRITPAGTVTEFSTGISASSNPYGITAGPDGNLWFTELNGNRIGQITTGGTVTEFATGISPDSGPAFITVGPDGNLWFAEFSGNRIGQITTGGTVTEFSQGITANSQPLGITAGPDGSLWFTEFGGNRIGRLSVIGGSATTTATVSEAPTTITVVGGTVNEGNFSGTVATFTHGGGAEPASEFTATIDWGDTTTSTGTVVSDGQGGYAVLGSHAFTEENAYTISVSVGEDEVGAATVTQSDTLTVLEGPFTVSAGPYSLAEGDTVGTVATFTHADEVEPVSDFSVLIDWGDQQGSMGSVSVAGSMYVVTDTLSHSYTEEGTYTVTITLEDDGNVVATQTTTATVSEPPISFFIVGTSTSFQEGQSTNGQFVADFFHANEVEPNSDFTATIDWGDGATSPGAVSIDIFGLYQVTANGPHAYGEEGTYTVTVTVSEDNVSNSVTFAQLVQGEPAILLHGAGTLSLIEGQVPGDVATFTHANGTEPVSDFSATITWGDGATTSGTIALVGTTYHVQGDHAYKEQGSYTVTVQVSEDSGANSSLKVTETAVVGEGPLTITVSASGPAEGTPFSGTVATFTHANGIEPASDFSATINWGDNTTSAGTVSLVGTSYQVTGSHTYTEDGAFTVAVTINEDGGAVSVTGSGSTSIAEGPLTLSVSAPSSLSEGQTFTGTVASFTHANGSEPATAFTATINWGDNSTSAGTVSLVGTSYQVTGSHAYAEDQAYTVTVTVSEDSGTVSASGTGSTTVTEGALTVTGAALGAPAEGTAFSGTVATFTHANGIEPASTFTATIDWGDHSTSAGTVSLSGTTYAVSGSHAYAEEGPYSVKVTVSDDSVSASVTDAVTVTEGPLTVSVSPASLTEGTAFSGTVATFTHANGVEPATAFTATINWGDNSTSAGTVSLSGTTYSVTGSHTYAEDGPFTVAVTVNEDGGAVSVTGSGSTTVAEGPLTVNVSAPAGLSEGQAFSGTVATFTHDNGSEPATAFAATITWGDNTTSAGTVTLSGTTYAVTGSHTYAEDGPFTVSVKVSEDAGAVSASSSAPTTVSEGPLTLSISTLPLEPKGQTFSGTVATFTHANGFEPATAFTATINWGDTHTSAGTVSLSGTTYQVQGSHAYSADGTYTVSVTVNEDAGAVSVSGSTTERVGTDVTSQITATVPGYSYNPLTQVFTGTLTLQNTSNSTVNGPFAVALNNIAPGWMVVNPDGTTAQGSPYLFVNVPSLAPGAKAMRSIQFKKTNPNAGALTFQFQIFSLG